MRRNNSDAGGRTESSTDLIARITAERESRTAETTTRTAPRTSNAPQTPDPAPRADSTTQVDTTRTTRTTRVIARPAGRHSSPDAADAAETMGETAVIDRVTQQVSAQPLEAAHIEQDEPDSDGGPDDRDFYPAPGSPRRSRRAVRPIGRRLAPLAVGAAVMLVATTVATLIQPSDEDQVAAPELSGQVIADQTPPPKYLDDVTPTTVPPPAPVVTPSPAAPAPAPAAAPPAPKPAPKPTKDEGTQAAAKMGWKLVGGDEFNGDGLSGQWGSYDGKGHDGKGRREPGKVSVEGGNLVIKGDGDGNTGGVSYKDGQKYGKWELRAKFPAGDKQYHPVLILWPDAENWPEGGEIDFAETNSAADDVSFFLHYNPSNEQDSESKKLDITQWHNYAVEWVSGRITGYIDGQKWFESTNGDAMPPGAMHPTIQLDYFPSGGDPKNSEMLVDFMRVYQ
jgi:hypothetical protein